MTDNYIWGEGGGRFIQAIWEYQRNSWLFIRNYSLFPIQFCDLLSASVQFLVFYTKRQFRTEELLLNSVDVIRQL